MIKIISGIIKWSGAAQLTCVKSIAVLTTFMTWSVTWQRQKPLSTLLMEL